MRVALTGAAAGIGAATATRLKADGAEIVAFDIHRPGDNVDRWIEVDLARPESIARAARRLETIEGLATHAEPRP